MSEVRGLPLLSGPPPTVDSGDSCRKCNKEFNMFLNRSRKCNHCGYLYCHNCSDFQAMMPRGGQDAGYDLMHVCAFCIDFLNTTAAGRGQLKTMPLSKLKKYVDAYNIKIDRAVEKDDLIEAMLKARNANGCLSRENENFYRKYSVPNRSTRRPGLFSRSGPSSAPPPPRPASSRPTNFPRPDLAPDPPPHQHHYAPPRGPPPHQQQYPSHRPSPPVHPRPQQYRPPPPPPHPHSYPQNQYHGHYPHYTHAPPPVPPHGSRPQPQGYPPYQRPSAARSHENLHQPDASQTPTRQRAATAAPPPAPPTPTLDELLNMTAEAIGSLSVHALKAILFTNHVSAGPVLEKSELVARVNVLIENERRHRERQRAQEEAEEAERIARQQEMLEEYKRAQREREENMKGEQQAEASGAKQEQGEGTSRGTEEGDKRPGPKSAPSPPPKIPPKHRGTAADLERTGLCVICQDDEANIAIVDCGHLAMCRGCADLIMASSRECPLCRTRIVTEARLLRIFKS
ncbi:hypothetical protein LshimejAT787_1101300 [Lyophyllum shimeji]|uniref:RING-type domain-containing protein n=1 Tax=Lyophyllum shimeji TaxID=47721 RepID=A0A9P3US71_LYOSH|nr:hypothetical protein LshimejAT787_1101300 [Lyophyllum shimeji]